MPNLLLIDADPGIGDALAIALALLDPEVEVLGLTAAAGCVSGEHATYNLHAIVSLIDPDRWPRMGCSELPQASLPPTAAGNPCLNMLHGRGGLGECAPPTATLHQRHESPKLIADIVRENPHRVTLLTLGPLTNTQLACELYPELMANLAGLVCLGGAISGGGDVTAAAEFNIYADPDAARAILTAHAATTLIPLDVARRLVLSFERYRSLSVDQFSPLGRLLEQTIPFALRMHHELLGTEGLPLKEVVALASIVRPDLFERQMLPVDVETAGELTRGATVIDRRGHPGRQPNVDVCVNADIQGIIDWMTRRIQAAIR